MLTFGLALEALKKDKKVQRIGWNGKGMWLTLVSASNYTIKDYLEIELEGVHRLPWIGMKTADEGFVPWLASQTDVLAEDWVIVE